MKVITINNSGTPSVSLGADSAVLRSGEPVFVPDPVSDWRTAIVPAVRICHLGMNILPVMAPKYYDSVGLFHILVPAQPSPELPWGLIDRTFSPGAWQPVGAAVLDIAVERTPIGAEEPDLASSLAVDWSDLKVDDTIARLSRYCTLRTGDVLLFADFSVDMGSPVLDTAVRASINGAESIHIRIK